MSYSRTPFALESEGRRAFAGAQRVRINWREDAACLDASPDLFFPVGHGPEAERDEERAKRICQTCPVSAICLTWATTVGVTDGVWGGMTSDERRYARWVSTPPAAVAPRAAQAAVTLQRRS